MAQPEQTDPAAIHTAGARRAVELNDLRALLRHIVGWLMVVVRGERT